MTPTTGQESQGACSVGPAQLGRERLQEEGLLGFLACSSPCCLGDASHRHLRLGGLCNPAPGVTAICQGKQSPESDCAVPACGPDWHGEGWESIPGFVAAFHEVPQSLLLLSFF
jgi:hypothetical protein